MKKSIVFLILIFAGLFCKEENSDKTKGFAKSKYALCGVKYTGAPSCQPPQPGGCSTSKVYVTTENPDIKDDSFCRFITSSALDTSIVEDVPKIPCSKCEHNIGFCMAKVMASNGTHIEYTIKYGNAGAPSLEPIDVKGDCKVRHGTFYN